MRRRLGGARARLRMDWMRLYINVAVLCRHCKVIAVQREEVARAQGARFAAARGV